MTVALIFVAGMITTALLYGLYSLWPSESRQHRSGYYRIHRENWSHPMTAEERAEFIAAFETMDKAFAELGKIK